jgi:hypothetical protein
MANRTQDRKEETYDWIPTADQIAPGKVFGKGDGTAQVLMRETGMSNKAAQNNLKRLKEEGRIHILTWTRTKSPAAVWVRGAGEDAPRPPRLTPDEVLARKLRSQKTARENQKPKNDRNYVMLNARERTVSTIEQARQQPHSWFSALGSIDEQDGEQAA